MTTYKDHSEVITNDSAQAQIAQNALISLGIDLGKFGADGAWGENSRAAAKQWQEINGYETTGDITSRQMDALQMQAEHPSMYHRMQLQPFYENFNENLISTDDPVRRAMVAQAASHIGAIETGGNNVGPAVEQYFQADDRMNSGAAWCAAFGSWGIDQIENHAGLNNSDYMEGNMRVQEVHSRIKETAPNAIKSANDYTPQPGDMLLKLRPDGTGHYATVVNAFTAPNGDTAILTIDGNVGDDGQGMVAPTEYLLHTNQENGKSYNIVLEEPTNPDTWYIDTEEEMVIVDISELPNYNNLQAGFNANTTFVPTPSSDPNFNPDLGKLAELQDTMKMYQSQNAAQTKLPPLDFNAGVELSTTTAFNVPTPNG